MIATPVNCVWFGPVSYVPSWYWVGADVAERLKRSVSVRYFGDVDELPDHALVFWIKRPGNDDTARAVRRKNLTLLFFPVDCFLDPANIAEHQQFIDTVRLVCLHARSLAPYFPHVALAYVDHYNKYGVRHQERVAGDRYLWIGAFQYVPYVLQAVHRSSGFGKVILVTDHRRVSAWEAANVNAERMGMRHFERTLAQADIELVTWSETSQREALLTCRAAFDVKYGGCFNQRHKPPTKMQKYLCSGIPCAINEGVALRDQLEHEVACLSQLSERVADAAYQRTLQEHSERLTSELSLDKVAQRYLALANAVWRGHAVPRREEVVASM